MADVKIKVKVDINSTKINSRVEAGKKAMIISATEAVVKYGNIYVRVDKHKLEESALIASVPEKGLAIWDTPYAKKMYYTGTPSKDVNPNASLKWAEKGVKKHRKELNKEAQNAFEKGFGP